MFDPNNALRKMLGPTINTKSFGSNKISKDVRSKNSERGKIYQYPDKDITVSVIPMPSNPEKYGVRQRTVYKKSGKIKDDFLSTNKTKEGAKEDFKYYSGFGDVDFKRAFVSERFSEKRY